jgi:hypothetical protein
VIPLIDETSSAPKACPDAVLREPLHRHAMRFDGSIAAGLTLLFCAAVSLNAAPMHPVEWRLREELVKPEGWTR